MTGACPPRSNLPVASRNRRWIGTSVPRSTEVQQGKQYTSPRRALCRHQFPPTPCTMEAKRPASAPLLLRSPPSLHGTEPERCRDREGTVEPRRGLIATGLRCKTEQWPPGESAPSTDPA